MTAPKNNSPDNDGNPAAAQREEPVEIKFIPDYEAGEPIFWHVFEELSNENNGLVNYDNLQERLISTGKFYVGEAVLMIEHMEKIGEIE